MRTRKRVTEVGRASSIDILISREPQDYFKLNEVAEIVGMSVGYMRKLLNRKDAPQPSKTFSTGHMTTYLYTWRDVARVSTYVKENGRHAEDQEGRD